MIICSYILCNKINRYLVVQLVRDAFDQPASVVTTKTSNTDLVTETDQAVEKHLIDGLTAAFPDHK